MNVGDKVRMMTSAEEGVISRVVDDKTVEVEIEDGFHIPVLKSEVVLVSKSEAKWFGEDRGEVPTTKGGGGSSVAAKGRALDTKKTAPVRAVLSAKGIYLAFVPLNDQNLAMYLVNNTDYTLPYSVAEEKVNDLHGVDAGVLPGGQYKKLRERSLVNFDKWPDLIVQWLYHRHGIFTMKEPAYKRFKAKAATFYRNKRTAPLLDAEAYLFQIDGDMKVHDVDAAQIKEAMMTQKSSTEAPKGGNKGSRPVTDNLVDLHIEALVKDSSGMDNGAMLEVQLNRFEEALDQAIASGMHDITFIHGVGNGVLRDALHKRLSKTDHIKFFEDAMREKFGFGATRVQIH